MLQQPLGRPALFRPLVQTIIISELVFCVDNDRFARGTSNRRTSERDRRMTLADEAAHTYRSDVAAARTMPRQRSSRSRHRQRRPRSTLTQMTTIMMTKAKRVRRLAQQQLVAAAACAAATAVPLSPPSSRRSLSSSTTLMMMMSLLLRLLLAISASSVTSVRRLLLSSFYLRCCLLLRNMDMHRALLLVTSVQSSICRRLKCICTHNQTTEFKHRLQLYFVDWRDVRLILDSFR